MLCVATSFFFRVLLSLIPSPFLYYKLSSGTLPSLKLIYLFSSLLYLSLPRDRDLVSLGCRFMPRIWREPEMVGALDGMANQPFGHVPQSLGPLLRQSTATFSSTPPLRSSGGHETCRSPGTKAVGRGSRLEAMRPRMGAGQMGSYHPQAI